MKLHRYRSRLRALDTVGRTGRVKRIHATHIEADGPALPLGAQCTIEAAPLEGTKLIVAEIVRVDEDSVVLSPFESGVPTWPGALVTARPIATGVPVGDALLGRAVDALARPIDELGPLHADSLGDINGKAPSPLERVAPKSVFETGLRAIDGLLTLAKGQRIGIFAPSGAGKTTLLSQIASQAVADVTVICMVGERGREIETFWNETLAPEIRARSVLVGATSDQTAAMRVRAGDYALALAEHWRAQGLHVLLLLDSITRLAMAMREIGLAAGEPPTVRAYTPGVFAAMPRIVERCGAIRNGGAITAIMTVLSEGEDVDDPICELMKSLLDGHLVLSRVLAEQGQFPAIDVLRSISRMSDRLVDEAHLGRVRKVQNWLSQYEESRTLIEAGLYVASSNPALDTAIERRPAITRFLQQPRHEHSDFGQTGRSLAQLADGAR